MKNLSTEEVIEIIEQTANMLRGMTMDPAIPKHAKEAMRSRILQLDEAAEKLLKEAQ